MSQIPGLFLSNAASTPGSDVHRAQPLQSSQAFPSAETHSTALADTLHNVFGTSLTPAPQVQTTPVVSSTATSPVPGLNSYANLARSTSTHTASGTSDVPLNGAVPQVSTALEDGQAHSTTQSVQPLVRTAAGQKRKADSPHANDRRAGPPPTIDISSIRQGLRILYRDSLEARQAINIVCILLASGCPKDRLTAALSAIISGSGNSDLTTSQQSQRPLVSSNISTDHSISNAVVNLPTSSTTVQKLHGVPANGVVQLTELTSTAPPPIPRPMQSMNEKPKALDKAAYMAKLSALRTKNTAKSPASPMSTPAPLSASSPASSAAKIIDREAMNKRLAQKLAEARAQHAKSNATPSNTTPITVPSQAAHTRTWPTASDLNDAAIHGTSNIDTLSHEMPETQERMIIQASSSESDSEDSEDEVQPTKNPTATGFAENSVLSPRGIDAGKLDAKIKAMRAAIAARESRMASSTPESSLSVPATTTPLATTQPDSGEMDEVSTGIKGVETDAIAPEQQREAAAVEDADVVVEESYGSDDGSSPMDLSDGMSERSRDSDLEEGEIKEEVGRSEVENEAPAVEPAAFSNDAEMPNSNGADGYQSAASLTRSGQRDHEQDGSHERLELAQEVHYSDDHESYLSKARDEHNEDADHDLVAEATSSVEDTYLRQADNVARDRSKEPAQQVLDTTTGETEQNTSSYSTDDDSAAMDTSSDHSSDYEPLEGMARIDAARLNASVPQDFQFDDAELAREIELEQKALTDAEDYESTPYVPYAGTGITIHDESQGQVNNDPPSTITTTQEPPSRAVSKPYVPYEPKRFSRDVYYGPEFYQ